MAKTAKDQATESNQQTISELKKQNEKSATEEINAVLANNSKMIAANAANTDYRGVLRVGSDDKLYLGGSGLSMSEPVVIDDSGNVGISTATFGTSAAKVLGIANGTAPSSSPADMVQLYAEDVSSSSELKVRDEGGTVTVLSPHPWDAPDKLKFLGHGLDEYSASKNMYRGECYWFNRSKFYFDDTATKADCRMIETFAEYNKRRGLAKGDKGYLEVEDWDDNQLRQEAEVAAEVPKAKEHNASIRKHKRGVDKGEPADLPTPYRRKSKPEWL